MKLWNRAAICKILWRLYQKQDSLWIRWVHGFYIKQQNILEMAIPSQCSWILKKILGMRVHLQKLQDGADWLSKSEFSVSKLYQALLGEVERVEWAKMICQNPAPPKCVFSIWLLLHGKLPTCNFLQKIGIVVDPTCCLCGEETETIDHMFFACDVVQHVWAGVARWCGFDHRLGSWNEEHSYLLGQCRSNSGKQRRYRSAVSVVMYFVWKERNKRQFQGVSSMVEDIVKQCCFVLTFSWSKDRKLAGYLQQMHSRG